MVQVLRKDGRVVQVNSKPWFCSRVFAVLRNQLYPEEYAVPTIFDPIVEAAELPPQVLVVGRHFRYGRRDDDRKVWMEDGTPEGVALAHAVDLFELRNGEQRA